MWRWAYRGCMVCIYFSLRHVFAYPPTQVFLNWCTDDQEEENESGLFFAISLLMHAYITEWSILGGFPGSQKKNLGYQ